MEDREMQHGSYTVDEDQILRDVRVPNMYIGSTDFRLVMWDTYQRDRWGRSQLGYVLSHKGEVIFEGTDFGPSPMDFIDSDDAVRCLLGFLSLQPGDTDDEYFEKYTPEQMEFAVEHGEALSLASMEGDDDYQPEPLIDW